MFAEELLFHSFPREVANPRRWVVHSVEDFDNFIVYNNGINDCFTSVYPINGTIDKLFIDFDGIPQSITHAQTLFDYCINVLDIPCIPVASGIKGIHLYPLVRPDKYTKDQLYKHTAGLLQTAFNFNIPDTVDFHCVGDIKRMTRITNTLRPPKNHSYCTPLPIDKFPKMNWYDVVNYCNNPHFINYEKIVNTKQLLKLTELPESKLPTNKAIIKGIQNGVESKTWNAFLKLYLRPCLYRHITSENPVHSVRVAVTVDLLKVKEPHEILDIYSTLNWRDWDADTTIKQIQSCIGMRSYNCDTLIKYGIPRKCCIE